MIDDDDRRDEAAAEVGELDLDDALGDDVDEDEEDDDAAAFNEFGEETDDRE